VAAIKYKTFQNALDTLGGLINWASLTSLPATQFTGIQQYYANNAANAWIQNNWLAVCPNGEARFVGNQGQYPNNLAVTTYWTATAVTVTANSIANPADGKVSASKLLETAANSGHNVLQAMTFIPGATYQLTCYYRPIGGRYLYLRANDGVNDYYSTFSPSGAVTNTSSSVSMPSTMNQTANGFWVCNIFFTAASTAGVGYFGPGMSTDGTTVSYVGDVTKGIYAWGNVLSQTSYVSPTALLIPNDQLGEDFIDACFQVWQMSPVGAGYPVPQTFEMMPDGVQIIGTNGWVWNGWLWTFPTWYTAGYPVFLYYRKGCPSYSGNAFSTSTSYTVDTQILYNDATNGYDFWKCIVATSANESPATAPTKWEELKLPEFLFLHVVYKSAADYYRMDAQAEKATTYFDSLAQGYLDTQSDKQERQMGVQPPFRVATHQTVKAGGWAVR